MVYDRECTDILCFILFMVFIVCMIACAGYGFKAGDPMKLLKPFDDQGQACGDGALKDYKYKYMTDLLS